jgi:hypothetical protein
MGLLDNPFSKNKFGTANTSLLDPSKPVFGSTPNVATFGNTEVITNKPIVTQSPYALPTGNFKIEKSQAQKDFESRMKLQERMKKDGIFNTETEKKTWWENRSKTQKALIVSGSALVVLTTVYFIYKSVKK